MATNYTNESDFYSESDNYGTLNDETTSYAKNYRGMYMYLESETFTAKCFVDENDLFRSLF